MRRIWITLAAVVMLPSCGDDQVALVDPPPPTGSIQVTTATSGWDSDVDGFGVYLDGEDVGHMEPEGALTLSDLAPGAHELRLDDVASNCVAVENPLQTVALLDSTVVAPFEVDCEPLPYVAVDLGHSGYSGSRAHQINNRGQVIGDLLSRCGSIMVDDPCSAFLWENGLMIELPYWGVDFYSGYPETKINDLGQVLLASMVWDNGAIRELGSSGSDSYAIEINELGEVVGWIRPSDDMRNYVQAVVWRDDVMLDLGVPDGCTGSEGRHLNNAGQVIVSGLSDDCDSYVCTCGNYLWEDGTFEDLSPLYPIALNDRGQIAGRVGEYPNRVAAIWKDGVVTEIAGLGEPRDINDAGQVIGGCFLWDTGEIIDLVTVEDHRGCTPARINNAGVVVGSYAFDDGTRVWNRAFVWEEGLLRDLPLLDGAEHLDSADASWINDLGQAVGSTYCRLGRGQLADCERAVLWEKQKPDPD